MREKIYNIVHVYDNSKLSLVYKYFMIFVIALSLVPLATKEENELLSIMEIFCFVVFLQMLKCELCRYVRDS